MMKYVFGTIGGVVALFALTWAIQGNGFFLYKFFAPKEEAVRREVFEQSKAYNDGMREELRAMQFQYEQASPDQKKALGSIILHRVAGYNEDNLPSDLRAFVKGLR
jgi:hypothetical protein